MCVDKLPFILGISECGAGSGACPFRDLPDSKRILASCGSRTGLPALTRVGEGRVGLLLFVPGRGGPMAWEPRGVRGSPGVPLWELEREWWRETKFPSRHTGLSPSSLCICNSCLLLPTSRRLLQGCGLGLEAGQSFLPWSLRLGGNLSGLLCEVPVWPSRPSLLFASQTSPASL